MIHEIGVDKILKDSFFFKRLNGTSANLEIRNSIIRFRMPSIEEARKIMALYSEVRDEKNKSLKARFPIGIENHDFIYSEPKELASREAHLKKRGLKVQFENDRLETNELRIAGGIGTARAPILIKILDEMLKRSPELQKIAAEKETVLKKTSINTQTIIPGEKSAPTFPQNQREFCERAREMNMRSRARNVPGR